MKKIILISIFLIISVISFGQNEMKGRYNFRDTVRAPRIVANTIRSNDTNGIIIITDKYRHVIPFGAGQLIQENSKTGGVFGGAAMMLKYLAADTSIVGVGICLIPMGNMGGYDTMAFLGYVGKGGTKHYAVLVGKNGLMMSSDTAQLEMASKYFTINVGRGTTLSNFTIYPDTINMRSKHIVQSVNIGTGKLVNEIGDTLNFQMALSAGIMSGYKNIHDSLFVGHFLMAGYYSDTIAGIGYMDFKRHILNVVVVGKHNISMTLDSTNISLNDTILSLKAGRYNNYSVLMLFPNRTILSAKQKIDIAIRGRSGIYLDTVSVNITLDVNKRELLFNDATGLYINYNNVAKINVDSHYFKTTVPIMVNKLPATPPATVTDIDGNIYNTVTIGNQTWLRTSLITTRYKNGDTIPLVSEVNWDADTIHGQYGVYSSFLGFEYNWAAVDSSAGLCPYGWHIPNETEVDTLVNYLGGVLIAGGKLKDTSFTSSYWNTYPVNGRNLYGFNMKGTGYRFNNSDIMLGRYGYFWTSNEVDSVTGKLVQFFDDDSSMTYFDRPKVSGATVRCIMDTLPIYIDHSIITPNKVTSDTVNAQWYQIQINSGSMAVASSDTITLTGAICVILGTDTVTYMRLPSTNYTGLVTLISDSGFSVNDTGNINAGATIKTFGIKRVYLFMCIMGELNLIY